MYARKDLLTLEREGPCRARVAARFARNSWEGVVDAERFDRLVESLTRSGTRRGALRTLTGAILGAAGLGALAGADAAGKAKARSKRREGGKGKNGKGQSRVRAQAVSCCSDGNCKPGAGKNLSKCCYESQNLAGKSFKGANLSGANFSGAILTNANFTSANLDKTCFVDADVTGAKFTSANTATAIFCRTQTSQGLNNAGCGNATACCETCNRDIGETCTGAGDVCCAGAECCPDGCRDLNVAENNCGACGAACGAGLTCCSGQCVDLLTDENNCTECGNVCPTSLPNADVYCGLGKDDNGQEVRGCVFQCGRDFRDCNDDPDDGCEVRIFNNDLNCGGCGTNCGDITPQDPNDPFVCKGCKCGLRNSPVSTQCQELSSARLIRRR